MPDRFSTLRSFAIHQHWCRFVRLPLFLICAFFAAETVWAQSGAPQVRLPSRTTIAPATTAALRFHRDFARPSLPTISVTSATWLSRPMACSMSILGAAAISTTIRRRPAVSGGAQGFKRRRQGRRDRALRRRCRARFRRRQRHRILQRRGLRRAERQDHPLCHPGGFDCASRSAGYRRLGAAAYRRSPHASLRHRRAGPHLCRSRLGDQFLPVRQSHAEFARARPLHRTEARAGTWLYDADKTGQHFSAAERYIAGLRNGEGFGFDLSGRLFATQHGRDQLSQNFSKLYTPAQSAELPGRGNRAVAKRLITAGRSAITTAISKSSFWRRNMAATAARRSASALRRRRRWLHSSDIGRRTIS